MSLIADKARILRAKIEDLASSHIEDAEAPGYADLFPSWRWDGHSYAAGDRVRYENDIYKCLMAHESQAGWTPTDAPSLWAKVLIPDPEIIPVWERPGSTNPYMTGDKVHFPTIEDPVYESLIDNNTWSPAEYPAGWRELT